MAAQTEVYVTKGFLKQISNQLSFIYLGGQGDGSTSYISFNRLYIR